MFHSPNWDPNVLLHTRLQVELVYKVFLHLHHNCNAHNCSCIGTFRHTCDTEDKIIFFSKWIPLEILSLGMKSVGPKNPSSERVISQLKTSIIESSLLKLDWLTSHKALQTSTLVAIGDNSPKINRVDLSDLFQNEWLNNLN